MYSIGMERLTRQDLLDLATSDDIDLKRALWEIYHLRATVLQCNDYLSRGTWGSPELMAITLRGLLERLAAEPVVIEDAAGRKALIRR